MKGRALILAAIRQIVDAPTGIVDLRETLGMSEQSARLLIKDLRAADLIERRGTRPARNPEGRGGRPTKLYGWKGKA